MHFSISDQKNVSISEDLHLCINAHPRLFQNVEMCHLEVLIFILIFFFLVVEEIQQNRLKCLRVVVFFSKYMKDELQSAK